MECRSVLVLGGARSGKSRYAQNLAESCGRAALFVATAEPFDEEMRTRIARHRRERGSLWRTVEAPLDLVDMLGRIAADTQVILVDCLTLWLSNLVLGGLDAREETERLGRLIPQLSGRTVFVSNEVGSGIVPDNPLGRRFRDEQGRLNQAVAGACDAVVLVAAGLPVQMKPAPEPRFRDWERPCPA